MLLKGPIPEGTTVGELEVKGHCCSDGCAGEDQLTKLLRAPFSAYTFCMLADVHRNCC